MTTRHHIEYQSTDNRFSDVQRTMDYEEFVSNQFGENPEEAPEIEEWANKMFDYVMAMAGGKGRVRVWFVTREEIDLDSLPVGLAQAKLGG